MPKNYPQIQQHQPLPPTRLCLTVVGNSVFFFLKYVFILNFTFSLFLCIFFQPHKGQNPLFSLLRSSVLRHWELVVSVPPRPALSPLWGEWSRILPVHTPVTWGFPAAAARPANPRGAPELLGGSGFALQAAAPSPCLGKGKAIKHKPAASSPAQSSTEGQGLRPHSSSQP